MIPRLLVLTDADDCTNPEQLGFAAFDEVVLGCWTAPETSTRFKAAGAKACWDLMREWSEHAGGSAGRLYGVAHELIAAIQPYQGVNVFRGYETVIALALASPALSEFFKERLRERHPAGFRLEFLSESALRDSVDGPPARLESQPSVTRAARRLRKFLSLCGEVLHDRNPSQLFWTPLEVLDATYAVRGSLWPRYRGARGGIWMYGTYGNFTRCLGRHAQGKSSPPRWLVNSRSARRGVPRDVRAVSYVWQFRGTGEHRRSRACAADYVEELRVRAAAAPAASAPGLSATIESMAPALERVARNVMAEVDLLARFFDDVAPDEVWVANQWGGESAFIQLARARGIPVVQTQHGTLEQFYAFAPLYSDRFLVWSELWRSLVNPAEGHRVEVVNPGVEAGSVARSEASGPSRVTFFTAFPGGRHKPFWNPSVVCQEVIGVLSELVARGHDVTVRVHPVERVSDWRRAWVTHAGPIPGRVRFDKHSPLDAVLARTDVALIFDSTVFVDCLAAGIPVVAIGWLPNPWRGPLAQRPGMFFGDSLSETLHLLQHCASRTPTHACGTPAGVKAAAHNTA